MKRVEIGDADGRIALLLNKQSAIDLAHVFGPSDLAYGELLNAVKEAYPKPYLQDENPCIHTPARCNGGGYDGCACGKYR